MQTSDKNLTDEDILTMFRDIEDNNRRHLYCSACDPEMKVSLCGYKGKRKSKKLPIIFLPIIFLRLRKTCKRCRELAFPHAKLHGYNII